MSLTVFLGSMLKTSLMLNYWILQTIAMALTALLVPRLRITSLLGALFMVAALTVVNTTLWDSQLFASIPTQLTTQAFYLFIANGVIFWLLVKLLPGIESEGIIPALFGPVVFTICSILVNTYAPLVDWKQIAGSTAGTVSAVREGFMGPNSNSSETAAPVPAPSPTKETKTKSRKSANVQKF